MRGRAQSTSEKGRVGARRPYLLAGAAGVGTALCWLPLGVEPALPLVLLLAVRALRFARTPREAAVCGMLYGGLFWAVAAHFFYALLSFSLLGLPLYLLVIAFILPYSALEFWGAFQLASRFGMPRGLGLTLLYPLMERARTLSDASFPPDLLSHCFGDYPSWLAWNPWIGPFGFAMFAVGVAAILDCAIEMRADARRALSVTVLAPALWLAPPLTDSLLRPAASQSAPALKVGIVQPDVAVTEKLDRDRWPELWQRLRRLTLEVADDVDLVVWPETARPGAILWDGRAEKLPDQKMQALADQAGVPILYGCEIGRVEAGHLVALYNGAALVRPGGGGGEWYGKQKLLPFVEGVPFADLVGWDPARNRRGGERSALTMFGNFYKGPTLTVFEVGPARIGVLICFETQYPSLGRAYRRQGANLLLAITNDAWWGRSVFALWHSEMVASQARSLEVPVVRAANSGISSVSDRFGRILEKTGLFQVTTIQAVVHPSSRPPTLYARFGNLALWMATLLIVGWVAATWLRGRRAGPGTKVGTSG